MVEEFGERATHFRKGDRVWAFARKPTIQWGCYAEYVAVPEPSVAIMPSKLLYEEAAAMPMAGLAAHQALNGDSEIEPGCSVLIHGAAGGVGHLAVQLACAAGAKVYATASGERAAYLQQLGVKAAIDYTSEDFTETVRRLCPEGVDLVLDLVGGAVTTRSLDVIRPGGGLVSLVTAPDPEVARQHDIRVRLLGVTPSGEQLHQLARKVDRGELRPFLQRIFPLTSAAEAQTTVAAGHGHGKLVLNL